MMQQDLSTAHNGKKTLKAYVTGFLLCLLLTVISFGIVWENILSDTYLYLTLAMLAIAQFFVQSICFLSLNSSKEGQWNLVPYIFTLMIIAILVGGSLWIMYNLNYNMMN